MPFAARGWEGGEVRLRVRVWVAVRMARVVSHSVFRERAERRYMLVHRAKATRGSVIRAFASLFQVPRPEFQRFLYHNPLLATLTSFIISRQTKHERNEPGLNVFCYHPDPGYLGGVSLLFFRVVSPSLLPSQTNFTVGGLIFWTPLLISTQLLPRNRIGHLLFNVS
jgi:hypothetical protein